MVEDTREGPSQKALDRVNRRRERKGPRRIFLKGALGAGLGVALGSGAAAITTGLPRESTEEEAKRKEAAFQEAKKRFLQEHDGKEVKIARGTVVFEKVNIRLEPFVRNFKTDGIDNTVKWEGRPERFDIFNGIVVNRDPKTGMRTDGDWLNFLLPDGREVYAKLSVAAQPRIVVTSGKTIVSESGELKFEPGPLESFQDQILVGITPEPPPAR